MTLPSRVIKSDGRVEPFDGDRISRDIYSATEFLGRPNPYLARELSDGVLHFLAADGSADPTPIGDLIDATVKVVRELGHPLLARALQDWTGANEPTRPPEPHAFLPPDLAAACRDGLLTFLGPASPSKILAATVTPPGGSSDARAWEDAIAETADQIGHLIIVDSPEKSLDDDRAAERCAETIVAAIKANGLAAVININVSEPSSGPDGAVPTVPGPRLPITERLLSALLDSAPAKLRIDWHLSRSDFLPEKRARLRHLAARVVAGDPIGFVVDHRSQPIALAEGVDRGNPAILAAIGIGLPRLLEIMGPETQDLPAKVGMLARLAIAAGRAFRETLRRHGSPAIGKEFLPDRSRILIVPTGLHEVVHFLSESWGAHDDTFIVTQKILLRLNAALLRAAHRLPSVIDGPPLELGSPGLSTLPDVATPYVQLSTASRLHAALGGGTSVISLPQEIASDPDAIVGLLEFACRQPGLGRFVLCPAKRRFRQLTAGW